MPVVESRVSPGARLAGVRKKTVGAAERSEILLQEAVALLRKQVQASAAKPTAGSQRVMSNLYKWLERSGGVAVKGDSVEITGDIAGRDIVQVFLMGLNVPDAGRDGNTRSGRNMVRRRETLPLPLPM
jgi:hypothetical protein